ncbi:MAG TPA: ABC transporter permease [Euzebyales bacterium]|nr:ABC transporter permease [Euzebyales bacterium]
MAQTQTVGARPVAGFDLMRILRQRRTARILSVVVFLLGWQLILPFLPTMLIPEPAEVLGFMWDELRGDTLGRTTVYEAFWISLRRLFIGFTIAFAIGVPVGLLMGINHWFERMFRDFVLVGLAMPSLIWALLTGLWFGLDSGATIITVVLAAVPFVIINTQEGVRDVPRELTDMARSFHVPRNEVVRHVVFPSLMPFFFASLRYGLANGWKGLVLAEVFAATSGAGWNIRYWYDAHRAQGVIGYALFFIIFALIVERLIFQRMANRVFRWRPSADDVPPEELVPQEGAVAPTEKQLQDS